jgi:hypothetical protein
MFLLSYKTFLSKRYLEQVIGFEPTNNGVAIHSLKPDLGTLAFMEERMGLEPTREAINPSTD